MHKDGCYRDKIGNCESEKGFSMNLHWHLSMQLAILLPFLTGIQEASPLKYPRSAAPWKMPHRPAGLGLQRN